MAKFSINIQSGKLEESTAPSKELIVGIDLGTTNSLVAYVKDGKAEVIKDANGKNALVPSILHFLADGGIAVGDQAKPYLQSDPANTVFSVKRLMGKSYKDIKEYTGLFSYKVIDDDQDRLVKVQVKDKFYTPVELSSFILAALKARAEKALNKEISKAVITVPAYFNDAQRQATRDAGKLAGLDVLRIVNEPTAASLAYGLQEQPDANQLVAVYDLGGGTFDVSILRLESGIYEVLSTNGDTFLGGDDLDRAIVKHWQQKTGVSAEHLDQSSLQEWRLLAEQAKKAISSHTEWSGTLSNGITLNLDRETFEQLLQPLLDKTLNSCAQALADAGLKSSDIKKVIMVGGSTRIPKIKQAVAEFFGQPVFDKVHPDEVVALGAAIQADVLAGNQKQVLLLDITPLSLGIETMGGLMDVILPRNSKVPNRVGRQYTTSKDGQTALRIAVFQGERDLVEHNRKLGEFILRGIPPMPAGLPKIEIAFILDADGILTVRASELRSGVAQSIEIRSQYGLSDEEMAKMLLDSIQNAQFDMNIKALLEARNEAHHILHSAEKFIQQHNSLFSEEELKKTLELCEELKTCIGEDNKDAIHSAIEALNNYTAPFAHKAMDVAVSGALKGKKALEE